MSSKVCISIPVLQPRNKCVHSVSPLGHLGKFTLSLHWMNLGNQPVEILIEDVYLLVTPSPQGEEDLEDEVNRAHAAKMERLENAELLHMRSQSEVTTGP
jgi:vacuolar protein sorting-associated protein 13A/C